METVAGIEFRTKGELEKFVRGIIDRTDVGCCLDDSEQAFIADLLKRHRHYQQKTGSGIRAIRIGLNTHWTPRKMLVICRTDGSETDVSWRMCIHPTSRAQDFKAACRNAVVQDILDFKRRAFDAGTTRLVFCVVTKQWIGWEQAHVDHDLPWPFDAIVRAFMESIGERASAAELTGEADNEVETRFADRDLAEEFRVFHWKRAKLRIIERTANLRTKRRTRNRS